MKTTHYLPLFAMMLVCHGCASISPANLTAQNEVSVESALNSVGCGIKRLYDGQRGLTTGLVPSEVEVKLALSASAKDSGQLSIDFSKHLETNTDIKTSSGYNSSSEASRSNTITIRFINVLTAPKDTVIYNQNPAQLRELITLLREEGVRSLGQKGGDMVVFDSTDCRSNDK